MRAPEPPCGAMTGINDELEVLKGWVFKPEYQGLKLFEDLARAEFMPEEQQRRLLDQRVSQITGFAARHVPFYRNYLTEKGLNAGDIRTAADLVRFPIIGKAEIIPRKLEFHAEYLPETEAIFGSAHSSGSSGKRSDVLITHRSNMMFSVMAIRLYRWFRMDLQGKMAAMLAPRGFADPLDNSPDHFVQRESDSWRYASTFFETGPYVAMTSTHPLEQRQDWLEQHRPHYLVTDPSILEEHAFAHVSRPVVDSLRSVLGIASQMTAGMRQRIEQGFGMPVDQNYGANEIGLIAGRCRAGRYHALAEHCLVEIVDAEGQPCKPGEAGRVLLTGFNNLAMPLIRYDVGDMAAAVDGPCACGRTLPSFTGLEGQYRRWLNVPPDSHRKYQVLVEGVQGHSPETMKHVRSYQMHLHLDHSIVFRICSPKALPEQLTDSIIRNWVRNFPAQADMLSIERVDHLQMPPNGKLPEFTSDFPDRPYQASPV